MNFLALSQAPPELDALIAICTPLTMLPASKPQTPRGPSKRPIASGEAKTSIPGAIMLFREAWVEIAMHFS